MQPLNQVRLKREVLDEDARAGRDGLLGGGLTGEQWCVLGLMQKCLGFEVLTQDS